MKRTTNAPTRITTVDATCEDCGRPIPEQDIRAYQLEAGDDSLPRSCEDCAEVAQ